MRHSDNTTLVLPECRRLLPALLRFGEEGAQERWRAEAMRYVEFCLTHLRSHDAALHQLAVALYSLQVGCRNSNVSESFYLRPDMQTPHDTNLMYLTDASVSAFGPSHDRQNLTCRPLAM